MQQHARDGAGVEGEADFVGEHVAGADRHDAERRVGAEQRGGHLADRAVAAGSDDGIVASARGCLARRVARGLDIAGPRACDRCAGPAECCRHLIDSGRAAEAGAGIGDDEEIVTHGVTYPSSGEAVNSMATCRRHCRLGGRCGVRNAGQTEGRRTLADGERRTGKNYTLRAKPFAPKVLLHIRMGACTTRFSRQR